MGGDTTQVSAADQQTPVSYFNEQLHEELGKQFQIMQQAGPGIMKIDVTMTDTETATPKSNLKYLATGTFPFVGGAQAEIRITDSVRQKA